MSQDDKQFLIETLSVELVHMLMEQYGWDMFRAMDELYHSETFRKMEDERSGLYYQGAGYIFQFLQNEIDRGVMA